MSLVAVKSSESRFKDSILELQSIFAHIDGLGSEGASGALTSEKLGELLLATLGRSFSEDDLADMVSAVDLNASGDVQFNEFLKMMDQARSEADLLSAASSSSSAAASAAEHKVDGEDDEEASEAAAAKAAAAAAAAKSASLQEEAEFVLTREDIKSIFQKFDTDKDGFVSFSELKEMLLAHGAKYADEEVHAMVHLVDPSNTGMISYPAFVRLMLSPED